VKKSARFAVSNFCEQVRNWEDYNEEDVEVMLFRKWMGHSVETELCVEILKN